MVRVSVLRTLFLHPPSFQGFDGGAGSRYQARREIRSFWYPTWLAQPAALVPGSRLVDAPPADLTLADVLPLAREYELAVLHTSAPSFAHDVKVAEALKGENPALRIGLIGAHVAVQREAALAASPALDFVCGNEFDFTIREIAEGRPPASVAGLSYRDIGGELHRTRSVDNVVAEIAHARRLFPQVKEYFFDDDTFTDDLPRAEAIARGLGRLGVTWSCNAKPDVPRASLEVLRDNGLRLLLVGYESGSQAILNNVRKGTRLDRAREFTRHARALGIKIHGTFILGLPGETRETIEATIRFAREIDPHTLQVSLAAPYPGTALYREALERGWLESEGLVDGRGTQASVIGYPHLPRTEIFRALETFYRRFYFRPRKLVALGGEMLRDRAVMKRRLGEGLDFVRFLARRRQEAASSSPTVANP